MKIDQTLNLVTTINRDTLPAYVYVTPFPYEVVEEHHEVLSQVFSRFYQNVGELGAARSAAMMLRKAVKDSLPKDYQGPTVVDEIARFTTVIAWNGKKWQRYQLEQAIKNEIISLDEWRDIEGEVVFFIVGSAIQKKSLIPPMIGRILSAYGARLTSSGITEFSDSLLESKTELNQDQAEEVAPQQTSGAVHIPS